MRKITKRSAIIASAAVVVVGGAGAAFAAWSLNSSETVTSTAESASPLVVSGQTLVGTLYPGSINGVQFNAHNPNKFPVKVTGIKMDPAIQEVHVKNFLDCVKSRKLPNGDVYIGHRSAQASHLGNISYIQKRRIDFDPVREEILPF